MRARHIARITAVAVFIAAVQIGAEATAGAATMIETVPRSTVEHPQPLRATAIGTGPYCNYDLGTDAMSCHTTQDAAQAACPYTLMRVYDGLSLTMATAWLGYCLNAPCRAGLIYRHDRIDYYWPGTSYGVNNRISSVETYSSCQVKFFDYYDTSRSDNPSSAWIVRDGNLDTWSNRASSWQLRYGG
jgi:hypothetical protein